MGCTVSKANNTQKRELVKKRDKIGQKSPIQKTEGRHLQDQSYVQPAHRDPIPTPGSPAKHSQVIQDPTKAPKTRGAQIEILVPSSPQKDQKSPSLDPANALEHNQNDSDSQRIIYNLVKSKHTKIRIKEQIHERRVLENKSSQTDNNYLDVYYQNRLRADTSKMELLLKRYKLEKLKNSFVSGNSVQNTLEMEILQEDRNNSSSGDPQNGQNGANLRSSPFVIGGSPKRKMVAGGAPELSLGRGVCSAVKSEAKSVPKSDISAIKVKNNKKKKHKIILKSGNFEEKEEDLQGQKQLKGKKKTFQGNKYRPGRQKRVSEYVFENKNIAGGETRLVVFTSSSSATSSSGIASGAPKSIASNRAEFDSNSSPDKPQTSNKLPEGLREASKRLGRGDTDRETPFQRVKLDIRQQSFEPLVSYAGVRRSVQAQPRRMQRGVTVVGAGELANEARNFKFPPSPLGSPQKVYRGYFDQNSMLTPSLHSSPFIKNKLSVDNNPKNAKNGKNQLNQKSAKNDFIKMRSNSKHSYFNEDGQIVKNYDIEAPISDSRGNKVNMNLRALQRVNSDQRGTMGQDIQNALREMGYQRQQVSNGLGSPKKSQQRLSTVFPQNQRNMVMEAGNVQRRGRYLSHYHPGVFVSIQAASRQRNISTIQHSKKSIQKEFGLQGGLKQSSGLEHNRSFAAGGSPKAVYRTRTRVDRNGRFRTQIHLKSPQRPLGSVLNSSSRLATLRTLQNSPQNTKNQYPQSSTNIDQNGQIRVPEQPFMLNLRSVSMPRATNSIQASPKKQITEKIQKKKITKIPQKLTKKAFQRAGVYKTSTGSLNKRQIKPIESQESEVRGSPASTNNAIVKRFRGNSFALNDIGSDSRIIPMSQAALRLSST